MKATYKVYYLGQSNALYLFKDIKNGNISPKSDFWLDYPEECTNLLTNEEAKSFLGRKLSRTNAITKQRTYIEYIPDDDGIFYPKYTTAGKDDSSYWDSRESLMRD